MRKTFTFRGIGGRTAAKVDRHSHPMLIAAAPSDLRFHVSYQRLRSREATRKQVTAGIGILDGRLGQ